MNWFCPGAPPTATACDVDRGPGRLAYFRAVETPGAARAPRIGPTSGRPPPRARQLRGTALPMTRAPRKKSVPPIFFPAPRPQTGGTRRPRSLAALHVAAPVGLVFRFVPTSKRAAVRHAAGNAYRKTPRRAGRRPPTTSRFSAAGGCWRRRSPSTRASLCEPVGRVRLGRPRHDAAVPRERFRPGSTATRPPKWEVRRARAASNPEAHDGSRSSTGGLSFIST